MMHFTVTDGEKDISSAAVLPLPEPQCGGAELYRIIVNADAPRLRIAWTEPMRGHIAVWTPDCGRNRGLPQWFHAQKTDACFFRGAPVLAAVRPDGNTHCVVSLDDAAVHSSLGYYVDDFSERDTVVFFAELFDVGAGYETVLRIDKKSAPLPQALGDVWRRWTAGIEKAVSLPEDAFAPLYSTWYAFHQDPKQDALTQELRLAAGLGFRTVILDDGWQIEGGGTKDYLKSGDWTPAPDKFPDFAGFVQSAHALGLKLLLWFSVPFVGFETEAYRRFRDKLLYAERGYINAGTLDIRYPDVREYLVGTYLRFIRDYDIDGLKLDFIDNFRENEDTPAYNGEMDVPTVSGAVRKLLEEICAAAVGEKPDFLFEYRQHYVGPEILRYGNLLRVADCAFDAVTNRIGAVDLRMMTRDVAVHSDMLYWSPTETVENCALQLLNVMFSTPQISVRLTAAGEEQRRLIGAFLAYHRANREILTRGELRASHPESGYSAVSAECAEKNRRITVLYSDSAARFDGKNEDVWNAAGGKTAVIQNEDRVRLSVRVYDCFGTPLQDFRSDDAAIAVSVPAGGYLNMRRAQD